MINLGIPIIIGTVGVIEINHKDDHTRIASLFVEPQFYRSETMGHRFWYSKNTPETQLKYPNSFQ
jgi:hypothetical protein